MNKTHLCVINLILFLNHAVFAHDVRITIFEKDNDGHESHLIEGVARPEGQSSARDEQLEEMRVEQRLRERVTIDGPVRI